MRLHFCFFNDLETSYTLIGWKMMKVPSSDFYEFLSISSLDFQFPYSVADVGNLPFPDATPYPAEDPTEGRHYLQLPSNIPPLQVGMTTFVQDARRILGENEMAWRYKISLYIVFCVGVSLFLNIRQLFPRWWFQNSSYVHPYLGKWSNWTNIFEMGWNHQLVSIFIWIQVKQNVMSWIPLIRFNAVCTWVCRGSKDSKNRNLKKVAWKRSFFGSKLIPWPIGSMYGIFTYIYHTININQPSM